MKKAKRLLALGAAAMMLISAVSLPVYATPITNYKDTDWSFSITPNNTYGVTGLRDKVDASGTYVFYKEGVVPAVTCDVLNPAGVSQCTKRGVLNKGQKGLIAQYVYENGYDECKLETSASASGYGGANGKWSPDSIGYYPYINT